MVLPISRKIAEFLVYTWSNVSNIYLYQTCDSPGNHWWATVNLTAANLGPLKGQSTGSLQGPDRETGWPPEAQATWATWIPGTKMIPGIHGTTILWAKIRTRTGLEPQRIITGQTTYVHISCFHESWSFICNCFLGRKKYLFDENKLYW